VTVLLSEEETYKILKAACSG